MSYTGSAPASDEFISLEAPCEADATGAEGGGLQVEAPDVNGAEVATGAEGGGLQVEAPDVNGAEVAKGEEGGHLQVGAPDVNGAEVVKGEEGGDLRVEAPVVNGAEVLAPGLQPEVEACAVSSSPKPSDGNIDLEEGQVEDMDLADDDVVVKDELLDANGPEVSVAAVRTVIGFEVKLDKGAGAENASVYESNSISVEESRILSSGVFIYFC
jgi:zinc finger CCHC domain-containing protein 8